MGNARMQLHIGNVLIMIEQEVQQRTRWVAAKFDAHAHLMKGTWPPPGEYAGTACGNRIKPNPFPFPRPPACPACSEKAS